MSKVLIEPYSRIDTGVITCIINMHNRHAMNNENILNLLYHSILLLFAETLFSNIHSWQSKNKIVVQLYLKILYLHGLRESLRVRNR